MDFLTDTTLLVDLWRERSQPGPAFRFVEKHTEAVVGLPWVAKGEFLRGARVAGHAHDAVEAFLDTFLVIWPTEGILHRYADVYADLRRANALVGPNDLWVAACAVDLHLPLITRNALEFSRVKELTVVDYTITNH